MELDAFLGTNIPLDKKLYNSLTDKRFTAKDFKEIDENITYRTINYWSEKGYLLSLRQDSDRDWRKISFTEYVWILLLNELREMGATIERIISILFTELGFPEKERHEMSETQLARLKGLSFDSLLTEISKEQVLENLTWLLVSIISYKTPITLRFLNNGEYIEVYGNPAYHGIAVQTLIDQYKERILKSNFESSISISLDGLIKTFIEKKDLNNITDLNLLSPEEIEIVSYVRSTELTELNIKFKEGSPDMIELTNVIKHGDKGKRVEEYLLSDYSELRAVTNGGKEVFLQRTNKIKLGK